MEEIRKEHVLDMDGIIKILEEKKASREERKASRNHEDEKAQTMRITRIARKSGATGVVLEDNRAIVDLGEGELPEIQVRIVPRKETLVYREAYIEPPYIHPRMVSGKETGTWYLAISEEISETLKRSGLWQK